MKRSPVQFDSDYGVDDDDDDYDDDDDDDDDEDDDDDDDDDDDEDDDHYKRIELRGERNKQATQSKRVRLFVWNKIRSWSQFNPARSKSDSLGNTQLVVLVVQVVIR
ncbi:hypothetical protein PoB_002889500 [Plakobranchus ocellatus]|uniref:Uncharacterized protein n=1 Tax=Plakobranchus ocellatus TaxID=259542 RepID=A0AAV4A4Q9_9GAST|nr:hypothetical protein PoB_002889500 [Plakobranchus ocellatus]